MTVAETCPQDSPDWDHIAEQIICPLCDYDLRGLAEPRCPECGYRFDWPEILDPTRRLHPYLFEHHPERRLWSFGKTLWGGLRPRRFWQTLHPAQPSYLRRLLLYWLLCALLFALLIEVMAGVEVVRVSKAIAARAASMRLQIATKLGRQLNDKYRQRIIAEYGSVEKFLDQAFPVKTTWQVTLRAARLMRAFQRPLFVLAWPWLTFVSLLIFQISMRRARVRLAHVLRCVVYSCDVLVWVGLVGLFGVGLAAGLAALGVSTRGWIDDELILLLGILAAVIYVPYRLIAAYRHYLKFDHPIATIVATQVIVALVGLDVVALIELWR